MNKIVRMIQEQYAKDKVGTIFGGLILLFALLNFLKPSTTDGILTYIGISAINLVVLAVGFLFLWVVFIRKNKGRRR